jgi:hypothetical protein
VQLFLLLFFLLFTAIGVLFARRALAQGDAPDLRSRSRPARRRRWPRSGASTAR